MRTGLGADIVFSRVRCDTMHHWGDIQTLRYFPAVWGWSEGPGSAYRHSFDGRYWRELRNLKPADLVTDMQLSELRWLAESYMHVDGDQ